MHSEDCAGVRDHMKSRDLSRSHRLNHNSGCSQGLGGRFSGGDVASYCGRGRVIPSFRIRLFKVVRFMPRRAAAPALPPITHPASRKTFMPVEGSIPRISGIEMYGNSVPVESVGGDLFEYINFQQRYDIDARIQQALNLSKEFLDPLPPGATPRNSVDDHEKRN